MGTGRCSTRIRGSPSEKAPIPEKTAHRRPVRTRCKQALCCLTMTCRSGGPIVANVIAGPGLFGEPEAALAKPRDVTELLIALRGGDRQAMDELVPLVYEELKRIARSKLRLERRGHTLNTTALVNEAYLKLVQVDSIQWQSRAHFLAIAAQAMRNILVSHARTRKRVKRGGGAPHVPLAEAADLPVAEAN